AWLAVSHALFVCHGAATAAYDTGGETEPSEDIMARAVAADTGLKSNTRTAMIALLNARLAEAIDLALTVKQAHWNLKGPTFIAVHEFLDEVRDDLAEHVDTIAERAAQLDGIALGTLAAVSSATTLPAYPTDIRKVEDHLKALVDHFTRVSKAA